MITVPPADQIDETDDGPTNDPREPPYRTAGTVLLLIVALVFELSWALFRGYFDTNVTVVLMAERAGLSMDPGSKVTFNGVPIGRLVSTDVATDGGHTRAKLTLDVKPQYLPLVPANVDAQLRATTVFGNKYISFLSPAHPSRDSLAPNAVINATATTTEFNTVFETIMGIAEQVDPVKLNATLTATAQALNGLGDEFGRALVDGNVVLSEFNSLMPQLRRDIIGLADLSTIYADSAADLFDGLDHATIGAHTINTERATVDAALMAAVGFADTASEVFERGGPCAAHKICCRRAPYWTTTVRSCCAPCATTAMSLPASRRCSAATAIRSGCGMSWWGRPIAMCSRTIFPGSTPAADPAGAPDVGSRSPGTCSRCPTW